MAIKINDTKIALKSGFNKYLKVHGNGQVLGISDAVGAMEQLEPIFQVNCELIPCTHIGRPLNDYYLFCD